MARRAEQQKSRQRLTWTDHLAFELWETTAFLLLVVPFVLIWSATQNLLIAIVATPLLGIVMWKLGGRFLQWWRSI